jgi:hypothetical protein
MLALALTGEALGEEQWQTVTSPDGGFTVEMPPGKVFHFQDELNRERNSLYVAPVSCRPGGQKRDVYRPRRYVSGRLRHLEPKVIHGGVPQSAGEEI